MTIAELVTDLHRRIGELNDRERFVAAAAEELNQSTAVQSAWSGGQQHERDQIVALIDLQLEQLNRAGLNAVSLATLRHSILSGS